MNKYPIILIKEIHLQNSLTKLFVTFVNVEKGKNLCTAHNTKVNIEFSANEK